MDTSWYHRFVHFFFPSSRQMWYVWKGGMSVHQPVCQAPQLIHGPHPNARIWRKLARKSLPQKEARLLDISTPSPVQRKQNCGENFISSSPTYRSGRIFVRSYWPRQHSVARLSLWQVRESSTLTRMASISPTSAHFILRVVPWK